MDSSQKTVTFFTQVRDYWRAYGGSSAIVRSEFLWFSVIITALTYKLWDIENWWDLVLQSVPTLMGLSLASLTLFLGAGSESFREFIAGRSSEEEKYSPFEKTAAVFVHFLVVQSLALLFAFLSKALFQFPPLACLQEISEFLRPVFWGVGYFFFVYALFTVLAATFAIFEVVRWYDEFITLKKK